MIAWLLVGLIVALTAAADVLQSLEMKRQPKAGVGYTLQILHRPMLLASIACMALSFFSFLVLLRRADLSFAVPATALSVVVETALARWILKEQVDDRRWLGVLLVAGGVALLAA